MASVNKVCLLGNLGKDPDIKTTQDGREIAHLTVATSESWKDKNTGEKKEKTEWHRVVIFSEGLVRVCKDYLKKGSKVYLEGSLQTRKWTDSSGVDKYTTEVVMKAYGSTLVMLGGGDNNATGSSNFATPSAAPVQEFVAENIDDEIPF